MHCSSDTGTGRLFASHLTRVGKGLSTTVKAYNEAVGSFESRVLPAGRRLEQMKVAESAKSPLEAPPLVEQRLREPRDDPAR